MADVCSSLNIVDSVGIDLRRTRGGFSSLAVSPAGSHEAPALAASGCSQPAWQRSRFCELGDGLRKSTEDNLGNVVAGGFIEPVSAGDGIDDAPILVDERAPGGTITRLTTLDKLGGSHQVHPRHRWFIREAAFPETSY